VDTPSGLRFAAALLVPRSTRPRVTLRSVRRVPGPRRQRRVCADWPDRAPDAPARRWVRLGSELDMPSWPTGVRGHDRSHGGVVKLCGARPSAEAAGRPPWRRRL